MVDAWKKKENSWSMV